MSASAKWVLDEIDHFLSLGESLNQLADSMGRTLTSMIKLAERHGRNDLAMLLRNAR